MSLRLWLTTSRTTHRIRKGLWPFQPTSQAIAPRTPAATKRRLPPRFLQCRSPARLSSVGGGESVDAGAAEVGNGEWRATDIIRQFLRFVHHNQVVFYISFSLVLTGMALLYTLMAAYGSYNASSSTSRTLDDSSSRRRLLSDSNNSLPDRQPLLADGRSPTGGPDSPDYELYSRAPWSRSGLTPSPVTGAKSDIGVGSNAPITSLGKSVPPLCAPVTRKAYSICASGVRGSSNAHNMGKHFVKAPTTMFPTCVLDLCSQDAPITFSAFLPSPDRNRFQWLAHGRHSEVFLVSSLLKRTVLKVMPVVGNFSQQRVEAITAAIECYLMLNALRHGMRYKAPNFIEVQRVACVFDHFPDCLLRNDQSHASTESLADSLASEIAGTNDCCLTRHFVVFELCYAGKPLSRVTLRSAVQGRSVVQQAACCVAVAERALGFRHLGVDADKLLVATTEAASFEYHFLGRDPLSVESAGLKAHLTGCLSCALQPEDKDDDDFEYREDSFGSPSSDCSGRAPPRFYGNIMWLGAVVDSVVHKLRSEVSEHRARSERAIIEELLAWQSRLQQCNSAAEFEHQEDRDAVRPPDPVRPVDIGPRDVPASTREGRHPLTPSEPDKDKRNILPCDGRILVYLIVVLALTVALAVVLITASSRSRPEELTTPRSTVARKEKPSVDNSDALARSRNATFRRQLTTVLAGDQGTSVAQNYGAVEDVAKKDELVSPS
ncbi:hypothetical protein MTO96_020745 [Rhipicephalus appendiculatus]